MDSATSRERTDAATAWERAATTTAEDPERGAPGPRLRPDFREDRAGHAADSAVSRSRENAVKHGLSGDGVAMPSALREIFQEQLAVYESVVHPADDYERTLVRDLALASARRSYASELEFELIARNRLRDLDQWDDDRACEAERLGKKLAADPAGTVLELRRTSAGCSWLIDRWAVLGEALVESPDHWTEAELQLACDLLGLPRALRALDFRARDLEQLWQAARSGDGDAHQALLDHLDEELQALKELRRRREVIEQDEYQSLQAGFRFDLSPAAKRLYRYQADAERLYQRTWNQLQSYRSHRESPAHGRFPAPPPRPAPRKPNPALDRDDDDLDLDLNLDDNLALDFDPDLPRERDPRRTSACRPRLPLPTPTPTPTPTPAPPRVADPEPATPPSKAERARKLKAAIEALNALVAPAAGSTPTPEPRPDPSP